MDLSHEFCINSPGADITMVGHSKGGAEVAANAYSKSVNGYLFNPATLNYSAYDLDEYYNFNQSVDDRNLWSFIVETGPLYNVVGKFYPASIDQIIMISVTKKYSVIIDGGNVKNFITEDSKENHQLFSVKAAI